MPTGKNWVHFLYLNLGFTIYLFSIYYFTSLKEIKDNWATYRCNPMYMPLSDDLKKDFVYCIQTMQSDYMGYILQPLTFSTASLTNIAGNFSSEINNIRNMFSQTRTFMSDIVQKIFGVFLNIIIEFQKIIIGMKDLVAKTIGIMTTLLFILDGSMKTMQSLWNGPNGQLVRSLGNCFHPTTLILLKNGECVEMKNVNLGDTLENGSKVVSTMKLIQEDNDVFYKLYNYSSGEYIYVTGTHMIQDYNNNFIEVQYHPESIKVPNLKCDYLSCLITDTHLIKIGNRTFWDYDDRIIRKQ
jgi:hypothetical protein